jgi:hypothetical protein
LVPLGWSLFDTPADWFDRASASGATFFAGCRFFRSWRTWEHLTPDARLRRHWDLDGVLSFLDLTLLCCRHLLLPPSLGCNDSMCYADNAGPSVHGQSRPE